MALYSTTQLAKAALSPSKVSIVASKRPPRYPGDKPQTRLEFVKNRPKIIALPLGRTISQRGRRVVFDPVYGQQVVDEQDFLVGRRHVPTAGPEHLAEIREMEEAATVRAELDEHEAEVAHMRVRRSRAQTRAQLIHNATAAEHLQQLDEIEELRDLEDEIYYSDGASDIPPYATPGRRRMMRAPLPPMAGYDSDDEDLAYGLRSPRMISGADMYDMPHLNGRGFQGRNRRRGMGVPVPMRSQGYDRYHPAGNRMGWGDRARRLFSRGGDRGRSSYSTMSSSSTDDPRYGRRMHPNAMYEREMGHGYASSSDGRGYHPRSGARGVRAGSYPVGDD